MYSLPKVDLTETEQAIVAQTLSQPVIKKYFTRLAIEIAEDILTNTEPKDGESAESFLRRQKNECGRLEAIETLLSIQPLTFKEKS